MSLSAPESGHGSMSRAYEWSPESGWLQPAADLIIRTWEPAVDAELRTFRTSDRARLDLTRGQWFPDTGWLQPAADRDIRAWSPSFAAELACTRTRDHAPLDVRGYEWSPEPAWIFSSLPATTTTAQQWPAILQNLGSAIAAMSGRVRGYVRRHVH
jgi:hypothetical protein